MISERQQNRMESVVNDTFLKSRVFPSLYRKKKDTCQKKILKLSEEKQPDMILIGKKSNPSRNRYCNANEISSKSPLPPFLIVTWRKANQN